MPGIVFLEIDGLAHDVLRRALRDGNAPTLSHWLREGSHQLVPWETDWSSQTGACQAGLLHGDNHDMPAFRWWEKDRGAAIVTNHPRDAAELERRHSNGRGLLHADGASRANILSGDAVHSMLTMSTVMNRRRPIGRDYSAYFARPYAAARTFCPRPRRHRARALRSGLPAAARRGAAHIPLPQVRGRPRLGNRRSARPADRGRGGRHAGRAARHLHDLPGLRRGRPPFGNRARRTRWPSCARSTARSPACAAPPPTRRGPTGSSSCPITARRRARRSSTATG